MSKRRVVVTGLGIISPVGNDVNTSWNNIISGNNGVTLLTDVDFDIEKFPTRFGAPVKNFSVEPYLSVKEARKMDVFIQYGVVAGMQAMQDSGLVVTDENRDRIGVVIGSGIGGLPNIQSNCVALAEQGPRRVSPFFVPGAIINMTSGLLSINLGIHGPNYAIATACASGTHSIGMAARNIIHGEADVMLAGGAEKASCGIGMAGFSACRALSTRNDDPAHASRPWDKDRDGFVLGDGAGVVVLEELEHAKARGAKIYAELVGIGFSGDAYHMTAPTTDGKGAAKCMQNALRDAQLNVDQISYINAHGTSTPAGDLAEVCAIKSVFGDNAYKFPVSSTKSMTGHLLGAAGAIEAVFSILTIRDQIVPPTINLEQASDDCDLDFVKGEARSMTVDTVLSNSFGFGGTNGSLIFRRVF